MWIETTRFTSEGKPLPREHYCAEHDYRVIFADTGRSNVPEEVANCVISNNNSFKAVNNNEEETNDT